jgi:16S rRNA C967 or C1407 C5-methylase (RsmB/RsmF family)
MELTKEYFDEQLKAQTKELKQFAEEQTDALARIIATTVAEPMERHFEKIDKELDVYAEVKQLKADMERIKKALHLSPSGA